MTVSFPALKAPPPPPPHINKALPFLALGWVDIDALKYVSPWQTGLLERLVTFTKPSRLLLIAFMHIGTGHKLQEVKLAFQ